jgi:hypothetical protein
MTTCIQSVWSYESSELPYGMDAWHLILTARLLDLQCSELSEREEETRRLSPFVMVNQDEQTPNNMFLPPDLPLPFPT